MIIKIFCSISSLNFMCSFKCSFKDLYYENQIKLYKQEKLYTKSRRFISLNVKNMLISFL